MPAVLTAGKPLNTVIFTIHKLLALGAVITGGLRIAMALKIAPPPVLGVIMLILAGICVIALFATGALMSMDKPNYAFLKIVHQIALVLATFALPLVVYLLMMSVPAK
jgi:hypothetical protein